MQNNDTIHENGVPSELNTKKPRTSVKCGTATTTLTILARAMRGTPGSPDRIGISLRVMPTVGRIIHRNGVPSELNNKKTRTSVKCGTATTTLTILARAMRGAPGFSDGNGDFLSGYVYCGQNNTRK